jgi:hypothetical protein
VPVASPPKPSASDAPIVEPVATDTRFRTPQVRMGLILIVPTKDKTGSLAITETKHGGLVTLKDGSGIERDLALSVSELRKLAEHANRIATLVAKRPEWKP